jgi:eukaryotic-like serine/threonine-protein kinase
MELSAGTKLGPYEIVKPLGAGGMGEVYRAKDTRLGREVAIKLLPESFAKDADRLWRFEQEARAVAALNHPNILAIHDVAENNGAPFLVSEFLEGNSLRQELNRSALPMRRAVDYGTQIAQGLAAAHDKGIIHRDLKPENIFVTQDGRLKILDFGLAKLSKLESAADGDATLEAATKETSPGVILGTVGYMSPEQVKGEAADARSDIFALGTILYEMLTGSRAFQRNTSAETMTAILKEDPPEMSAPSRSVVPALERIVRRCLEKKPLQRFQSARDLAFALEAFSGVSSTSTALVTSSGWLQSKRRLLLAGVAVLVLAAVVGGWMLRRRAGAAVLPSYHQLTFERGLIYAARFAPDGRSIYYSASWNGQPIQLYSTLLGSPESRSLNLPNSTLFAVSASEMAVSLGCKDLFIGNCEGTLALVPVSGGAPREVADNVVSADWTADDSEMAVIRETGGKFHVEFPIGKTIYESNKWLYYLRISPHSEQVAFAEYEDAVGDPGRILILDRNGKQIAQSASSYSLEGVAWSPSGEEVWYGSTERDAWADEIHALDARGKDRIILRLPGMLRLYDVARDGRILFSRETWTIGMQFRGPRDAKERDLSWLDGPFAADLSANGENLAFTEVGWASGGLYLAYVRKSDGSQALRLGEGGQPIFSPDGKWVLALAEAHGLKGLILLPTGSGATRRLNTEGIHQFFSHGWMPDGNQVYFCGDDSHGWRCYVQDIEGGVARAVTPVITVKRPYFEPHAVSPDGKFIFARDMAGKARLYPLAGGEPQSIPGWLPGDIWITWSPDGHSAYLYHDEKTFAPVYRFDLTTGKRSLVATLAPSDVAGVTGYDSVTFTVDGKSYAYSYNRNMSDLFLLDGIR